MSVVLPYFHPTSVVLIDDDIEFLNNLNETLLSYNYLCHVYSQGKQFLANDSHNIYRSALNDRIVTMDRDDDNLQFEPNVLIKEVSTPQRYDQVSVVIIDYDMPTINGLEICQQIENPYIKKILLTGAADENTAVEAFNEGIISQYIRKQDPKFLDRLIGAIQKCQYNYFHEILMIPLKLLATRYEGTALVDPAFVEFFKQLIHKHHIQEYYLFENTGSFIMIDDQQRIFTLMTLDDNMIDVYLDSESGERLSSAYTQLIQRKELIPCYYHPVRKPNVETPQLEDYLRPPQVIQGQKRAYYCVFEQDLAPLDGIDLALQDFSS